MATLIWLVLYVDLGLNSSDAGLTGNFISFYSSIVVNVILLWGNTDMAGVICKPCIELFRCRINWKLYFISPVSARHFANSFVIAERPPRSMQ